MSIVQVDFEYGCRDKIKALDEETYQRLRGVLSLVNLPESREGAHDYSLHLGETLIDMESDGPFLSGLGLEFKVKKFKGNMWLNGGPPSVAQPHSVHVHVPNIGLLSIDEVTWVEDACTENLQRMLNDGWRMLAVCPPNSQRRPDYILGRVKGVA